MEMFFFFFGWGNGWIYFFLGGGTDENLFLFFVFLAGRVLAIEAHLPLPCSLLGDFPLLNEVAHGKPAVSSFVPFELGYLRAKTCKSRGLFCFLCS